MAAPTHFYPYGSGVGDSVDAKKDGYKTDVIPMSASFVLYGKSFNHLQVGTFV